MRWRTRLLVLLVVLGSAGLAFWLSATYTEKPPLQRYLTVPVERGTLSLTVNATGTVNAVITVQVGTQVSGRIQHLMADFNAAVQAGDVIAQIDPALFATKVSQAEANVASAKASVQVAQAAIANARAAVETSRAQVESARANVDKAHVSLADARRVLNRTRELVQRALVSQNDLDTAQATYDTATAQLKAAEAQQEATTSQLTSAQAQARLAEAQHIAAQAQVEQAQAALRAAQLDLQHTTIRAPVQGIVVSRNVDVGQTVAASLQSPTLFLIAQDLTQMQVDSNVSEADIGRIQVGQSATFTVDAYPALTFRGTVSQVRNAPVTVQNVVTYNAVVRVANPALRLKPGMTANVTFLIAEHQDALKVPNAALRFQPEEAASFQESSPVASRPPPRSDGERGSRGKTGDTAPTPERLGRVWVLGSNGAPEGRAVTLGLANDTQTEVLAGDLTVGQQVITGLVAPGKTAPRTAPPGFGPPGRAF